MNELALRMSESFREVVGYEGLYLISDLGRVFSLRKKAFLRPCKNRQGYFCINLSKNGITKGHKVHRLVGKAFIDNPENKKEIDHINEDKSDNRIENLRWVTPKENMNNPLTRKKWKWNNTYWVGRKHSKETKRKLSLIKGKKVININTGEIYNSAKEASIKVNRALCAVSAAIRDNTKCAGFYWKYL